MRVVKRLHLFILKSFLPLFAMTFFIVLFVVLMQFLWRYIDDLVGKGLSMGVIGELFFYAAVSMVPMALPLAILLASLMTFGNLGERFELTAMKAAGISLLRVMMPLIVVISGVAVGAFFFQNNVLPKAQVKMWTLLFSMRQKSPEVEIPVGVFYDQIPGINLFVSNKNRQTGMLYDVKIYDVRRGGENVTILISDSARMALTEDMQYIYLYLYKGNQYERMTTNSAMQNDPFRRERYDTKEILIPFDNNFNRLDEEGIRSQYVGKNIAELRHSIDSINLRVDSLGVINSALIANRSFPTVELESKKGALINKEAVTSLQQPGENVGKTEVEVKDKPALDFDSLINSLSPTSRTSVYSTAIREIESTRNAMMFEAEIIAQEKKIIRRHGIELFKKFTLSVACIIFFFIGAPLGAIIRKGGIGMPLVISVLLFLVYYIIDNTGYKMARDGHAEVWIGMWLSTFILAPLGIFVTYKAMNDSAVFDPDRIRQFFRKITMKKEVRSLSLKEVIINDVNPDTAREYIHELDEQCRQLLESLSKHRLAIGREIAVEGDNLGVKVDRLVEYLHDSRDKKLIELLNRLPVIKVNRFVRAVTLRKDIEQILDLNRQIELLFFPEDQPLADSPGKEIEGESEPEGMIAP